MPLTAKINPNNFFRPEIASLNAYKVIDATGMIKLDAMENPYSFPEDILNQWLASLKSCHLNRYPDPQARELSQLLKQVNQIPATCEILLGNGSDEIIQLLLMALPTTASVLAPAPAFVMYQQISRSLGLNYHSVPLTTDFELDLPAMLTAIQTYQPAIIFLAHPNNPTGNLFNLNAIKQIITASNGLIILDEAYAAFANSSFIPELETYPNLLVMRTLSKLGLAGLRLGFIAGQPEIIASLDKIRLPYNINTLTQASAVFALSKPEMFTQQTQAICQQRTLVFKQLQNLDNIQVYPSSANFILFKTATDQANIIFAKLKQHGILIKNLSPQGGLLSDCLRVTIGTESENKNFLNALKTILAELI